MKSTLLLLPALLLAQNAAAQRFRLGLKGSLNYATYRYGAADTDAQRLVRLGGGIVTRYAIGAARTWSVQAELLYAGKGREYVFGQETLRHRLAYLDLPILVQFRRNGLFAEAGPQISSLLRANFDSPYRRGAFHRREFAPVQFGYAVGLGYELPSGLSLTLRYTRDLTDIYSHYFFDGNELRHQGIMWGGDRNVVFQAQFAYLLPGHK